MLSEVYLSFGSNLGDRVNNISLGLVEVKKLSIVQNVSSLYETKPVGFTGQPAFINSASRIWTQLEPFQLLHELKEIQASVGIKPAFVNGPRGLDIDILIFGSWVITTPYLTIPHPHMAEREFVLTPLMEISPSLQHPVLRRSISYLSKQLISSKSGLTKRYTDHTNGTHKDSH